MTYSNEFQAVKVLHICSYVCSRVCHSMTVRFGRQTKHDFHPLFPVKPHIALRPTSYRDTLRHHRHFICNVFVFPERVSTDIVFWASTVGTYAELARDAKRLSRYHT